MLISDWSSDVCSSDLFTVSLLVIRFEAYNPTSLQILRTNPSQPVASSGINRPPRFIKAINKPTINKAVEGSTPRSEEHTSELQSLMRISYAVFCLKKKKQTTQSTTNKQKQQKVIRIQK